jgi:tetratricopeptide (TPR) repeat protein
MTFQKHLNIIIVFFISINLFGQSDSYNKHLLDGNLNYDENFVIAENSYRKAISINPDNIKGSYNLSNKYYEEELYDEALARQAQALKNAKTPNEKHSIHHNIGNILMKKGLCKEAFEAYKNALRNNSKDDETRYNLSLAKVCADEQNKNNEKKDDKKNKQDNKNNKQEEQNDKQDQNQKNDQENNDNKQENKNKPSKNKASAKLSPEQIKNLLKAMNNEEKKVQAKINEKKQKGVKIITEKDW